mmetsp:Transcript_151683/g.264300  ORF Transcript_151683/g.264300 Transcript_151683/m.264300 type:complete len:280 (-) Transcript_151683:497-1336(-)
MNLEHAILGARYRLGICCVTRVADESDFHLVCERRNLWHKGMCLLWERPRKRALHWHGERALCKEAAGLAFHLARLWTVCQAIERIAFECSVRRLFLIHHISLGADRCEGHVGWLATADLCAIAVRFPSAIWFGPQYEVLRCRELRPQGVAFFTCDCPSFWIIHRSVRVICIRQGRCAHQHWQALLLLSTNVIEVTGRRTRSGVLAFASAFAVRGVTCLTSVCDDFWEDDIIFLGHTFIIQVLTQWRVPAEHRLARVVVQSEITDFGEDGACQTIDGVL